MTDLQAESVLTPTLKKKPRQGRSPGFPFIPIKKALDRAEIFRVAEGGRPKHYSPLASAFSAWGIGAKTGAAQQTIAAMGHYGLFEFEGSGDNRSARLTELAFGILLDKLSISTERDELIRQAALKPAIHAELWQKWHSPLPSDPTLETYLIKDRGFSENGARDLIAEYKETISFANLFLPVSIPEEKENDLRVGDFVYWESGGQGRWKNPRKIVAIDVDDHGKNYLHVEDQSDNTEPSGWIAMNEATLGENDPGMGAGNSGRVFAPPPPPKADDHNEAPAGFAKEVSFLDEGEAIFIWPKEISAESVQDLEYWLKGIMRKAKRRAGVKDEDNSLLK